MLHNGISGREEHRIYGLVGASFSLDQTVLCFGSEKAVFRGLRPVVGFRMFRRRQWRRMCRKVGIGGTGAISRRQRLLRNGNCCDFLFPSSVFAGRKVAFNLMLSLSRLNPSVIKSNFGSIEGP